MMFAILATLITLQVALCQRYPIYGTTKRYGSYMARPWSPVKQPPMIRSQYPINYYAIYPDNQNYPDYYYYYHEYPIYPKTSKYEVYQAVLPYYYDEDRYRYEEDEDEVEEREENQPIGHETKYATSSDLMSRANAAFLKNLMASQMYNKPENKDDIYEDYKDELYDGYWENYSTTKKPDFDVQELNQLKKIKNKESDIHWLKSQPFREQYGNDFKRSLPIPEDGSKVTTNSPSNLPNGSMREEVMDRPATPVRQPFNKPLLDYIASRQLERKRTPSVFDTIKHMLEMEKNLKNKEVVRPAMKKRIISTEDSLAKQLTVLKKSHQ